MPRDSPPTSRSTRRTPSLRSTACRHKWWPAAGRRSRTRSRLHAHRPPDRVRRRRPGADRRCAGRRRRGVRWFDPAGSRDRRGRRCRRSETRDHAPPPSVGSRRHRARCVPVFPRAPDRRGSCARRVRLRLRRHATRAAELRAHRDDALRDGSYRDDADRTGAVERAEHHRQGARRRRVRRDRANGQYRRGGSSRGGSMSVRTGRQPQHGARRRVRTGRPRGVLLDRQRRCCASR